MVYIERKGFGVSTKNIHFGHEIRVTGFHLLSLHALILLYTGRGNHVRTEKKIIDFYTSLEHWIVEKRGANFSIEKTNLRNVT